MLVLVALLMVSIFEDAQNSKSQPFDMRNRITGSRIMKDGGSPYFYIWQPGDTVRYYDIHISPKAVVSQSTATPFYHWITEFFADFPQHKHNVYWFCIQYFLLGIVCLLAFLSLPPPHRWKGYIIISVATLFTYTIGWRMHVNAGQMYLLIPALAMVCYYCLLQKRDFLHLLLFGVCAAALVFIRPIAPLLFLPLLFFPKRFFSPLLAMSICMLVYVAFVFLQPLQKQNWVDYFKSVQLNIRIHQHEFDTADPPVFSSEPIRTFEGIDLDTQGSDYWNAELRKGSEMGNFYVIHEGVFHKRISVMTLTILGGIACLLVMLPLFFLVKKGVPVSLETLLIIGFLVYSTYEFFNPTIRAIYHWVQYLFPAMLLVICQRKVLLLPLLLLLAGIYLNIVIWPGVKMEHTVGEMLFNAGLLMIAYRQLLVKDKTEEKQRLKNNLYLY